MNERFCELFKTDKPIIGMLHLLGGSRQNVIDNAVKEAQMMTRHGVAAVLVENYFGSTQDVENVLEVLRGDYPDIVCGVNVLGDMDEAYRLATMYGVGFIQIDSVCGHLPAQREEGFFAHVDALRSECDALLFGGVRFKYQPVCSGRGVSEDLDIGRRHCDAIVVTGEGTGISTDLKKIMRFREILGDFPLIVGAGMTDATAAEQLMYSDGGIVGSYFKQGGDACAYMDEDRIARFMENAFKTAKRPE